MNDRKDQAYRAIVIRDHAQRIRVVGGISRKKSSRDRQAAMVLKAFFPWRAGGRSHAGETIAEFSNGNGE